MGSAFATPILALIGVARMPAVVGPLPGLLLSSATGAWAYWRNGNVDTWVAKRTIAGTFPAAIVGYRWIDREPIRRGPDTRCHVRCRAARSWASSAAPRRVIGASTVGPPTPHQVGVRRHRHWIRVRTARQWRGFLLVPLFLLTVGLTMSTATGTSLLVATVLTIPTLVTHAIIGAQHERGDCVDGDGDGDGVGEYAGEECDVADRGEQCRVDHGGAGAEEDRADGPGVAVAEPVQ